MYARTHSQVYPVSLKDSSPTLNHLRFFFCNLLFLFLKQGPMQPRLPQMHV